MTTTPDLSTYRAIHLAFRHGARGMALAAGDIRPEDRARISALARYWAGYAEELRLHHTTEDDLLFPALAGRVPVAAALIERTDAEHHEMDLIIERCHQAVAALVEGRVVPDLVASFGDLAAHIDHHLDFEDFDILPLFERHFTGDEYHELDQAAMKALGLGKQAAFTVPFAMYWVGDAEAAHLLAGAPAPFRILWWATRGRHARLTARAFGTEARQFPRFLDDAARGLSAARTD